MLVTLVIKFHGRFLFLASSVHLAWHWACLYSGYALSLLSFSLLRRCLHLSLLFFFFTIIISLSLSSFISSSSSSSSSPSLSVMAYAAKGLPLPGFLNTFMEFDRLFGRWKDHCMSSTHPRQQEHSVYIHICPKCDSTWRFQCLLSGRRLAHVSI